MWFFFFFCRRNIFVLLLNFFLLYLTWILQPPDLKPCCYKTKKSCASKKIHNTLTHFIHFLLKHCCPLWSFKISICDPSITGCVQFNQRVISVFISYLEATSSSLEKIREKFLLIINLRFIFCVYWLQIDIHCTKARSVSFFCCCLFSYSMNWSEVVLFMRCCLSGHNTEKVPSIWLCWIRVFLWPFTSDLFRITERL